MQALRVVPENIVKLFKDNNPNASDELIEWAHKQKVERINASLEFYNCPIGAIEFAKAIAKCKTVNYLNFSWNELGKDVGQFLIALQGSTITDLNLSFNLLKGNAQSIVNHINCITFDSINLSGNGFESSEIIKLEKAFRAAKLQNWSFNNHPKVYPNNTPFIMPEQENPLLFSQKSGAEDCNDIEDVSSDLSDDSELNFKLEI